VSADSIASAAQVAAAPARPSEVSRLTVLPEVPGVQRAGAGGFGEMVTSALGELNGQLLASQTDLQQLAVGNVQNLHQIMIRLEESRLSFQLLLQIRNRLLEAYQDVMKMQV
jgi:flagellar hook-basal body complex protein FliE